MSSTSASFDTVASGSPQASTRKRHPLRAFFALLKRELLSHKGSLVYTPLVVAGITLILSGLGMITGEGMRVQFGRQSPELSTLISLLGTEAMQPQRVLFFKGVFLTNFLLFHTCLFITVLVYCLGALYDERKDRSILFWKSMPVSDTRTVLSKLATAVLVAPAIMLAIMAVTWILLLCMFSLLVTRYDAPIWSTVWASSSTFTMLLRAAWVELVNGLWLLPLFGWVLFCSGWSRVRPFLWASMVPFWLIVLGKWITTTSMTRLGLDHVADWLLARFAAGVVPLGPGYGIREMRGFGALELSPEHVASTLAWPSMWIGVAIGVGFIALTIYWRRYRDESI